MTNDEASDMFVLMDLGIAGEISDEEFEKRYYLLSPEQQSETTRLLRKITKDGNAILESQGRA
jgi:hypothetical protein